MDDQAPSLDVENDLFTFESGHLALKGNEDYCEVLKTLVCLSAQREKALKDYKAIAELKIECLKDPFGTLKKMQTDNNLGIPPMLELPKLPKIDFQKYKMKVAESDLMEIYSDKPQNSPDKPIVEKATGGTYKAWSPEEQRRLEELLRIYPPEPIEMKRFQKIADALGNKTVHQVASRLQKYFLKLYKAGLPIPGRIPKCAEKYRKSAHHKHQRFNHYLWKPTTFFPELSIPVQMEDLNNIPGPSEVPTNTNNSSRNDNYLMRTDYLQSSGDTEATENFSPELQLKLLKRVREVKVCESADSYVPFSHAGYKCNYCDESPIVGTRWYCTVCSDSVDFCSDCVISQMYTETPHPFNHWLAAVQDDSGVKSSFIDGFSTSGPEFDRQISEELRNKDFEMDDENEDSSD
uniref:ZZ-type domain-containing protein n=2 Tax=Dendroctonus ponderosae TaxID=77166 RepID=A0AAR5P9A5_DENPD